MTKYTPVLEFTAQKLTVAALYSLIRRAEEDLSEPHEIAPIVVFMAFSMESYINSLGSRYIPNWDTFEKLPWKVKVVLLHNKAERTVDWGTNPLQFMCDIFRLRDRLAHGKPENVRGPEFSTEQDATAYAAALALDQNFSSYPLWFNRLNVTWIHHSKPKYQEVMAYLGQLFRLSESDLRLAITARIEARG